MKRVVLISVLMMIAAIVLAEGEAKAGKSVLLAFEKTRFKSQLIETMQKSLESDGYKVRVVEHSKKSFPGKAADHDAVFITGNGNNSQVRSWILTWLEENKADKAKIILHTTQTRDWEVKGGDVDAVTSASSNDDVGKLAADYVARLKKIADRK